MAYRSGPLQEQLQPASCGGRDEAMEFFVISAGLVRGKDGEPSKDVAHPVEAGAEAFAKLFLDDAIGRGLSVSELFAECR